MDETKMVNWQPIEAALRDGEIYYKVWVELLSDGSYKVFEP